jgi:hypothetical protein
VDPESFRDVRWVGIGDDDISYSVPLLSDYLDHYDFKDRIVLNPSADNIEEQRSAEGRVNVKWNLAARQCNAYIPERLMGTVVSRGLIDASSASFQAEALEHISESFDGSHDVLQGLLWWMYDAKWVPMALQTRDNEELRDGSLPSSHRLMISHKLRTPGDYQDLQSLEKEYFPPAEKLEGSSYAHSKHAKGGEQPQGLTKDCIPAA